MASPPAQASAQAPGTTSTLASTSTPASAPASPPRPPAGGNVREHAHVECGPARITVRRPSRCCSVEAIRLLPVVGTASTTTADGDAGPHQHQHHLPEIQEGSTLRLMSITEMGTTDSTNGNGNESGHGGEYDSGLATEGTVGGSGIGIGSGGLSPPIVMGTKLRARASTTVGTPGEPLGRPRAHTVGVRFPSRNNVTRFTESAAQGHRRGRSNTVRSSRSGRSGSPEPRSSLSLDITVPEARDTAIADHHGSLHDDVVGMLDVVDPEIGTGESGNSVTTNSASKPPSERHERYHVPQHPVAVVSPTAPDAQCDYRRVLCRPVSADA
jgi:hypothetical protein